MAQSAGRISCPRCGANNFNTVTACWKCGTALTAGASPQPQSASMPVPSSAYAPERPPVGPPPYAPAAPVSYSPAASLPDGDPAMAKRAAILMGLTIPFIGLPVGWAFMMIEDRRKQSIGRYCATWSLIGLLIQLLGMYVLAQQSAPFMMRLLGPALDAAARRNAGGGGNDGGLGGGLTP